MQQGVNMLIITEKQYKKYRLIRSIKCKAINFLIIAVMYFIHKYAVYGYTKEYISARIPTDSRIANLIISIPFIIMIVLLLILHYGNYRDNEKERYEKFRKGKNIW